MDKTETDEAAGAAGSLLVAGDEKVNGFAEAFKELPEPDVEVAVAELAAEPFDGAPNEKSGFGTDAFAVEAGVKENGEGADGVDDSAGAPANFFFGNPRIGLAAMEAAVCA